MKLDVAVDTRGFESTLQGWERDQLPFATALSLTRTAQRVQTAIRGTMQVSFDRPTPYTLNSLRLIPATKTKLWAEVRLKDANVKGLPPSVYLQPEVEGGTRQLKRSEFLLQQKGVLPSGMFWVPGSGAKLDQYGNVSRGQVIQILSAAQAFGQSGYLANQSKRRGARYNKATASIFIGKPAGGRLPLGVYQRASDGSLKPLMIFVSSAHYGVKLPIPQIATTVYTTNFQTEFNQALRDALILSPSTGGIS